MSFYGKVYQEKGLSFSDIIFENSQENDNSFPEENNEDKITFGATLAEDAGKIYLGNRWLAVTGVKNDDEAIKNELILFHGRPGGETSAYSTFSSADSLSEEKLASLRENKTTLDFGQEIIVENFQYDKAGHVASVSQEMWVMPTTPSATDFTELKGNINNLQNEVQSLQNTIGTGDEPQENSLIPRVEKLETGKAEQSDLNTTNGNLTRLQSTVAGLREELGNIGEVTSVTEASIASTIGLVTGLKEDWDESDTLVNYLGSLSNLEFDEGKSKSIIDALNILYNQLYSLHKTLANNVETIRIAVNSYDARLKALETELEQL